LFQVVDTVNQISTLVDPLVLAAKGDAAQLGRQVRKRRRIAFYSA